jgi:two-component system, OmpR family, phosphate regulon sensor histidine kinase PhoR
MKQNQIRFVVLLGAISIIGSIVVQGYFLQKSWTLKEKELHQTITIGLRQVAEKMCRLNHTAVPLDNPVKKLSSNYYVVEVNSVIDANILEYYLKSEFARLNFSTDYEYAIYDCSSNTMVYGNYITANGNVNTGKPSVNLPKYSEYLYYFGIHFPSIRSTVAGDMAIWFFFTSILILSVIFFVYTIFIILHQKRLSELQKDFINNMTHEFKTPISSINISADVIMQPGILHDPERLRMYGSVIKQENERLNRQVEKVLQVAKVEKYGFELKKENVDLNALIETVVDNFDTNSKKSVEIVTVLDENVGSIEADILHLTNIFHNLLDNAKKYCGENPLVRIETMRHKNRVTVYIIDNGPGIPPEYRKKVFQKFFRIPSGNIHEVNGFGLGLYYVKNICQAHHWKISLEEQNGKGAFFILDIGKGIKI